MSLTLTPLATDTFQRANVNPLVSPWAAPTLGGNTGLHIVSELCVGGGWQFYDYDLPDDQYASATIATLPEDENGFMLLVRATDNGENISVVPGYLLEVFQFPGNCLWTLRGASSVILSGSVAAINPGDVFTLAAVGTTIYVLQNGTILGSVTDTSYSSGGTALECDASEVHLSNFAIGSASGPSSLTITTDSLPDAAIGQPYSQTLQAIAGTTPYSWLKISGSLPPGLSLASDGVISGTPTGGGNFSFIVGVSDSSSPVGAAMATLGIDVAAGGPQAGGWNEYQRVVQQQPQPQAPRDWRPAPGAYKKF